MENLAPVYSVISIVAFVIAGISLAAAVFMWIKFDILKIIGDLSGRTARKSIEKKRSANEKSGKKSYRPTPVAEDRGAVTDVIEKGSKRKKKASKRSEEKKADNNTTLLEDVDATTKLDEEYETELLGEATTMLDEGTTMLDDGTTVLDDGTTVLNQESMNQQNVKPACRVVQEIVLLATEEFI